MLVGRRRSVACLAVIAALISACSSAPGSGEALATSSPTPAPTETAAPTPEYRDPFSLAVGDCFNPIYDSATDDFLAGSIVSCDVPHRMEFFGTLVLEGAPDDPYPGLGETDAQAIEGCDAAFEEYVGVAQEDSRLVYAYWYPSEETWALGDRTVLCAVEGSEASPLIRSVEGSGL